MNRVALQNSNFSEVPVRFGDPGGTVVKVLCYKSEGRWFDSDDVIGIFH